MRQSRVATHHECRGQHQTKVHDLRGDIPRVLEARKHDGRLYFAIVNMLGAVLCGVELAMASVRA